MANRIPVNEDEIEIGKVLRRDIHDQRGERMAAAGDLVVSAAHRQRLLIKGLWSADTDEDEIGEAGPVPIEESEKAVFPFEAMKLKVGDRLQLQLPELLSSERIIVRLIGYINQASLLVTPPRDVTGCRMKLLENDNLVVRVFTSQNAFGFSATVLKIINVPYEYLHISFPDEVRGMVIRKAPRVKTQIICSVVAEQSGEQGVSGMLVNLSANGAMLDARQALGAKGETIRVSFRITLHAVDALLTINAIVRSQFADEVISGSIPGVIHHGLEFVNLEPNDILILQSMIYQQMVEHPQTMM